MIRYGVSWQLSVNVSIEKQWRHLNSIHPDRERRAEAITEITSKGDPAFHPVDNSPHICG
jgi:hypothetical protein